MLAIAWAAALTLVAASPANTTPYDIDPIPHLVLSGGTMLVIGIAEAAVKPALLGGFLCRLTPAQDRCDTSVLNPWDRSVVGNKSAGWRLTSDVFATSAIVVPLLADYVDARMAGSLEPGNDAAIDGLILVESVAMATFFTSTLKFAIRRPRPTLYQPGIYSVENQLSFPSGHTSATAAATTAYAMTFALRHPDSPWRWVVMGAGIVVTGVAAYARVAGGMHFYTDVVAGMALGATSGFVIPYLNRRHAQVGVSWDMGRDGPHPILSLSMPFGVL